MITQKNFFRTNLIFSTLLFICFVTVAGADTNDWIIMQLTNNSVDDRYPHIDGNKVVWEGSDGSDFEIFLYDIDSNTVTQLTNNSFDDLRPRISEPDKAAWHGINASAEIYFYDGNSITRLTDNSFSDANPKISGSYVVWVGWAANADVFLYDGNSVRQLTGSGNNNFNPDIYGSKAVWEGWDGSDWEIYMYDIDANSTVNLSDNSITNDNLARISGPNVVWHAESGSIGTDKEVFFYNGSSTIRLTDNGYNDEYPTISGTRIAWSGNPEGKLGGDEVFLYNGSRTFQITVDNLADSYSSWPPVSNSIVAWLLFDNNDYEIMVYDGTEVVQLTDNNTEDSYLQLSGPVLVWQGYDGNDFEIFLALPKCYPRPTADLDGNCKVNLLDFSEMAAQWLDCNLFITADCN